MSQVIIATRGLPGSGKTTWAEWVALQLATHGASVLSISRDEVRAALGVTHGEAEARVTRIQHSRIREALDFGMEVIIVHDTLLTERAERALRRLADAGGARLLISSFLHVPLATCIARDALRAAPVGADVIRRMWRSWQSASRRRVSLPDEPTRPRNPKQGMNPTAAVFRVLGQHLQRHPSLKVRAIDFYRDGDDYTARRATVVVGLGVAPLLAWARTMASPRIECGPTRPTGRSDLAATGGLGDLGAVQVTVWSSVDASVVADLPSHVELDDLVRLATEHYDVDRGAA
ncbi:AAA family ATPase [Actinoalloteichus caeruleus]|uniref:Kinase n=1 Tax=Actinoalloteichus caeruleus DSM 43889 TaxID=1120930 RepID=A0ABT1JE20_ACTCY|nr:AAA family ATPase [Actinoalloteichus caeruleus]MCP2330743.1 putative kinase [Actinoalloteichus caeruleus DSM 43889]